MGCYQGRQWWGFVQGGQGLRNTVGADVSPPKEREWSSQHEEREHV